MWLCNYYGPYCHLSVSNPWEKTSAQCESFFCLQQKKNEKTKYKQLVMLISWITDGWRALYVFDLLLRGCHSAPEEGKPLWSRYSVWMFACTSETSDGDVSAVTLILHAWLTMQLRASPCLIFRGVKTKTSHGQTHSTRLTINSLVHSMESHSRPKQSNRANCFLLTVSSSQPPTSLTRKGEPGDHKRSLTDSEM